jgi:hypothetical protein
MGLLDDAIRDHLELRRLRGADPGDVARAEQDALGPAGGESGSEPSVQADSQADNLPRAGGSFSAESEQFSDAGTSVSSHGSQETIEINMEAELERDIDVEYGMDAPYDARTTPVGHPTYTQADAKESMMWEMESGRSDEQGRTAIPESSADSQPDSNSDVGQRADDMLEEARDFPREAPKQERLWFEQHPSRGFDFKE